MKTWRLGKAWCFCALIAILSAVTADAQWEGVYGGGNVETGYNGVLRVKNLDGGGFVAVGRTNSPTNGVGFDSYVVRVDANGAPPPGGVWPLWVNVSDNDAEGNNLKDEAASVTEIPANGGSNGAGGFLVVGTTDEPGGGGRDIYAMEIDPNGTVVWTATYGLQGRDETATDVTLTTNGEYVISGCSDGIGRLQGVLLRINPVGGALLWGRLYDLPAGKAAKLNAVTEAVMPPGPGMPGLIATDIVAVGWVQDLFQGGKEGWILRVSAAGVVMASVTHGWNGSDEEFNGLTELTLAPNTANLVAVGSTTARPPSGIYMVMTTANPAALAVQPVVGGIAPADASVAYDVREDTWGGNNVTGLGDLAVVGSTKAGGGAREMFLLGVTPALVPGRGFTYGDNIGPGGGFNDEEAFSVDLGNPGYILCGYTKGGGQQPIVNDPEQLYLVRPDGAGISGQEDGCEIEWIPCYESIDGEVVDISTSRHIFFVDTPWMRTSVHLPDYLPVCPRPGSGAEKPTNGPTVADEPLIGASAIRFYPNPIRRGSSVTVECASASGLPATLRVTNLPGEQVGSAISDAAGASVRFTIDTQGLPAGAYIVRIDDGATTRTVQLVVTE